MKSHSTASILAAVVVASFASMALLAPADRALAKGGSARAAMPQTKINSGMPNGAAGRIYCTGPGCPGARAREVKATTTGTYNISCNPGPHRHCH